MKTARLFAILIFMSVFSLNGFAAITQKEYLDAIKTVKTIYAPIVKEAGGNLVITGMWESTVINATAERDTNSVNWRVLTFGGLARLPLMKRDAFIIVLCHELGHHLGGYPKKRSDSEKWSSAEGQADYFATLKCARKIFADDDNEYIVKKLTPPAFLIESCHKSYPNELDANICIRSSMAAKTLSDTMEAATAKLYNETPSILSFEKSAWPMKLNGVNEGHGLSQCRLETYFQGSLCDKNINESLSDTQESNGNCSKSNGDDVGLRPKCWFNPK